MRIVAGKFRGKNLANSSNFDLRPTTDKNREALFNILSSAKSIKEIGFEIAGSRILDLCCGTGAFGFEALSRGADSVSFIDNNYDHLGLAKKNAKILGVENSVQFICADAKNLTPIKDKNFDLIFIDPPYAENYQDILQSLIKSDIITENSLIIIESDSQNNLQNIFCEKIKLLDSRKYAKTTFYFAIFAGRACRDHW